MTVTIGPRYGALMMAGHGDSLYVAAAKTNETRLSTWFKEVEA